MAGIEIPKEISGHSLYGLLKGENIPVNKYVFGAAAYSKLPEDYWDNPEPYYNPNSEKPFHTRVEDLTWESEEKTAMARTKNWKLIVSESDKPELYFMNDKNVERENLFGKASYKEVFQELKGEILNNWDYDFVWE